MGTPLANIKPQWNDVNGAPLSGGKFYAYAAGTSTAATTYSDYACSVANANPVVLDSRGEANIFLTDGSYKFVLKDSDDQTLWTVDNITVTSPDSTAQVATKYTIGYADIAAAALTDTETFLTLPQNTVIEWILVKCSEAFAGGSISSLLMDIGDSSDADELMASFDVMAAVAETNNQINDAAYMGSFSSTKAIIATFTAVGDNLDQLTAGSIDIWVSTKALG